MVLSSSSPGSACPPADRAFSCVQIPWSKIEPPASGSGISGDTTENSGGTYDEAFLAALRRELKGRSDEVLLEPLRDRPGEDAEFAAAVTHAARRLKDVECIKGLRLSFSAPVNSALKCALTPKHPHYRYSDAVPRATACASPKRNQIS